MQDVRYAPQSFRFLAAEANTGGSDIRRTAWQEMEWTGPHGSTPS